MNLPNIPTDNLYKFLAITGLFLIIFSWLYPEIKESDLEQQVIKLGTERNILEKKMNYFKMKSEVFNQFDSLEGILDSVSLSKNDLRSLEILLRNFKKSTEGQFNRADIESLTSK